jgi:hypothetical protein
MEFGIYMTAVLRYKALLLLPLLAMLAGCYDMTIQLSGLPANTPPSENLYISGNFNNWDPGDPNYIMQLNSDSVYEVSLPKGIGEIEYKFTRGDWSTVEKDPCGFEIANRSAFYGQDTIVFDTVRSWNDLPKQGCPSFTLIIDSVPENTPENAVFYLAANMNNWDPGSRYWMFKQGQDGKHYLEIPANMPSDTTWGIYLDEKHYYEIPRMYREDLVYKITRGDWRTVECDKDGNDIENRVSRGKAGDKILITIEAWKDR